MYRSLYSVIFTFLYIIYNIITIIFLASSLKNVTFDKLVLFNEQSCKLVFDKFEFDKYTLVKSLPIIFL